MPRHRLPPQLLLIAVSTAIAATCDGLRYFPPSKFPPGCATHLKRRTLHDRPLPARSHSRPPLRHSGSGQTRSVGGPSIHPDSYPQVLVRPLFPKDPPSPFLPINYLRLSPALATATYSATLSTSATPEPHSKHIIASGGFDQPILSTVFRPRSY